VRWVNGRESSERVVEGGDGDDVTDVGSRDRGNEQQKGP